MEPFCWRRLRLFQPSMGVSPTMKATVQHITTASPARRGVTTRLYLQEQTHVSTFSHSAVRARTLSYLLPFFMLAVVPGLIKGVIHERELLFKIQSTLTLYTRLLAAYFCLSKTVSANLYQQTLPFVALLLFVEGKTEFMVPKIGSILSANLLQ